MFFIPYGKVKIKTKLNREEIERRMKQQLTPLPRGLSPGTGYKFFRGNIGNGRFTLDRGTGRGTLFDPIVTGEIRQHNGFALIDITLRITSFALAVELFSLSFCILLSIVFFDSAWSEYMRYLNSQPGPHLRFALVLAGMGIIWPAGWYLFMITNFNTKTRRRLESLNDVLREGNRFDLSHLG